MTRNLRVRTRSRSIETTEHEIEERKYNLELMRHELEKGKVTIDVLKHFTTIITALLLILSYFGSRIIPVLQSIKLFSLRMSLGDFAVMALYLSLGFSLIGLAVATWAPDDLAHNTRIRLILIMIMGLLGLATMFIVIPLVII
jgi:hypothetical protein